MRYLKETVLEQILYQIFANIQFLIWELLEQAR